MKRLLKLPAVNAVCISLFTSFYALVFFMTSNKIEFENNLYYKEKASFWPAWNRFLAAGNQLHIARVLIGVTILIVVLLIIHHQPYDEYHTSILTHCLVVSTVLVLIAIAIFYLIILNDPTNMIEKFTLFILVQWTTVVFANLTYVLICRRR